MPRLDHEGYEVMTRAVYELLNQYPGLDREIAFEELDSGIAFSADNGALIMTEKRDIIDHVTQTCQYPFFIIYRTASTRAAQKLDALTFLDGIGKWICKEPAVIDGTEYILSEYPTLAGNRKIKKVTRNNSYGTEPDAKGVQDWLLPVSVEYTNEFDERSN